MNPPRVLVHAASEVCLRDHDGISRHASLRFTPKKNEVNKNIFSTRFHRNHTKSVSCVTFSNVTLPVLVSSGLDCNITVYNFRTHQVITTITTPNFIYSVHVLEREGVVYVGSASHDGKIRIYSSAADYDCVRTIRHSGYGFCQIAWCVYLCNDADWTCISGGADKIVWMHSMQTGKLLCALQGHEEDIRCIALSASGILASGSNDRTVRLWEMSTGRFLHTLRGHAAEVNEVKFVDDTEYVVTCSEDNTFRLWHSNGERLGVFSDYHGSHINSIAPVLISHELKPTTGIGALPPILLIVAGTDSDDDLTSASNAVELWRLDTGKLVGRCIGHREQVNSVAAISSPSDYLHLVATCGMDTSVRLWDITDFVVLSF